MPEPFKKLFRVSMNLAGQNVDVKSERIGPPSSPKDHSPTSTDFGNSEKLKFFKKRALDTQKLRDTLKYSDGILQFIGQYGGISQVTNPAWQKENTNIWDTCKSHLFTWIVLMTHQKQKRKNINWSLIFYEFMTQGSTIKRDCLSHKRISEYHGLLLHTLDIYHPELREFAEELCRYFECHYIDPYGCVIGQSPTNKILNASLFVPKSCLQEYSPFSGDGDTEHALSKQYAEVLSRLVHWSTLDAETALRYLQTTAAKIRKIEELPKGSLVLVKVENTKKESSSNGGIHWIYGRIAGKPEASMIRVYLAPDEVIVSSIKPENVIAVAENCMQYFTSSDDCFELDKCVTHSIDYAHTKIRKYCQHRVRRYLEENEVDDELMDEVFDKKCTLKQLNLLEEVVDFLEKPVSGSFIKETTEYIQQMIDSTIQDALHAPRFQVFQLTLQKKIDRLRALNQEQEFLREFNKVKQAFRDALEIIDAEKHKILSGERKKQVSGSWLTNIDQGVRKFLSKHGFEANAIPHNYLDEAPENLRAVRRNMVLLRRILKSYENGTDNFLLQELIDDLCASSYDAINKFMEDVEICFSLYLEKSWEDLPSASEELSALVNAQGLEEDLQSQLLDLVKDRDYLLNMKRMEEDPEFALSQRMATVPISGLVMSKFCRLENEHNTAITLWEPVVRIRPEDFDNSLEGAILNDDLNKVKQCLSQGTTYINEGDSNGVTPLHLSCSYMGNRPRLEITNYLLMFPEIDVFLTNFCGNTPFHYFVHIQTSPEAFQLYENLFMKFTQNLDILQQQNHKGETPLHQAILFSNMNAIRLLLQRGADPNIETELGSAVHYAVQAGNVEALQLLIESGGNHMRANSVGETPLDIALKLNHPEIASYLNGIKAPVCKIKDERSVRPKLRRNGTLEETIGKDILAMVNLRGNQRINRRKKKQRNITTQDLFSRSQVPSLIFEELVKQAETNKI